MQQDVQCTQVCGTGGHAFPFLAEPGIILASSLDYAETLRAVARLAVQSFADFCVVDVVEGGEVHRFQAPHADGSYASRKEPPLEYPLGRRHAHVSLSVLETGESVLMADVPASVLESLAQDAEQLRILQALRPESLTAVPILAHGRVLGVLLFLSSSRTNSGHDLASAEQLGRIAGLELENARQYGAARQALMLRDRVLGIIAHDLRNPLHTISISADLMKTVPLSEQQLAHQVQVITRSAQRMNRLIQDLLDVSTIAAGRMNLECQELRPQSLAREAADLHAARAAERSVCLEVAVSPGTPLVAADPDRILQVLSNLIENAVRFTPEGGCITILVSAVDDGVPFSVADTGSGIRSEDLPHLFESFWQGGERRGGAGLGLAIARGIIEAHGGRIWADSTVRKGSVFSFVIPSAAGRAVRPTGRGASARPRLVQLSSTRSGSYRNDGAAGRIHPAEVIGCSGREDCP